MRLDTLVDELNAYFRIADVENDDWSPAYEAVYDEPYWRDYVEPGYEGKWNGLMVRGVGAVERVATCVFPSDRIVAGLEPGTLLFSEHPLDFADEPGFLPLSRQSFETLKEQTQFVLITHSRRISAPASFITSWGVTVLPLDFDIFSPFSSMGKPWVTTAL